MVLGSSADHRRAANVDVLDRFGIVAAACAHFLERVERDHGQIDFRNFMLDHRRDMVAVVADGQKSAMHRRMQRLDAAIHDFREVGEFGDVAHRKSRRAERFGRPSGGDQLDALSHQCLGEVDQAGFVGNGNQRPADRMKIWCGNAFGGDSHVTSLQLIAPEASSARIWRRITTGADSMPVKFDAVHNNKVYQLIQPRTGTIATRRQGRCG